jgi:hypothetical protein
MIMSTNEMEQLCKEVCSRTSAEILITGAAAGKSWQEVSGLLKVHFRNEFVRRRTQASIGEMVRMLVILIGTHRQVYGELQAAVKAGRQTMTVQE